jgi:GNAT superfamily N-acetyltransferase
MITIRPAKLPDDQPVLLGFIEALQRYEAAFEPNRRLDASWAAEHLAALKRTAAQSAIFLAGDCAAAVGWAFVRAAEAPVYVRDEERRYGDLAELFVAAEARGQGAGRALIEACEAWARAQGLASLQIGHLAGNGLAAAAYARAGYTPYTVVQRKRL